MADAERERGGLARFARSFQLLQFAGEKRDVVGINPFLETDRISVFVIWPERIEEAGAGTSAGLDVVAERRQTCHPGSIFQTCHGPAEFFALVPFVRDVAEHQDGARDRS